MSIAVHIPFYNQEPYKKEGFRQLTRFDYLLENIDNLKKFPIKTNIFIHTHNNFLNNKILNAEIIIHNISNDDLEKGYLTWRVRSLMEKHLGNYEYYIYLEHDIKFTKENFEYWLEYKKKIKNNNLNLGFVIYENNNEKKSNYAVHTMKKFFKYIVIENQKYFINDFENYCCFWLYNKKIFNNFLNTKFWSFEKKLTNFRHNYGITERSALGLHAISCNYFKATLIPEINFKPDPDCFIEHITNNYFNKYQDENKKNLNDIRGVCKFNLNEIVSETKNQKEIKDNFYMIKYFKILLWKFRFLTRLVKK